MLYYIIGALPYILQLLLIVHIIKNHKPFLWLWLIVFLPYIGGIVYIIMEIIPDLISSGSVEKMGRALADTVNPTRKLSELESLVKRQDTVANRTNLADCYVEAERYQEALSLYNSCLTGPYSDDKDLLLKKIRAVYLWGKIDQAKELMEGFKKNHKLENASQVLLDLQINEDWEKLMDIFTNTNNFRVGYTCAEHFAKSGDTSSTQKVIDIMEENLRLYKYLKRTENYTWYKKTKKLFS